MHDEKKISCLSSDHHQDKKKKNSVLKKIERSQKKNPKTNFRRQNFPMFVKINKTKYVLRPQKKFFEVTTTTTLPEALLKTKTKNLKIFLKREKFLVIFAKKKSCYALSMTIYLFLC